MLSKPATLLMGLIQEKPLNAYEIIKMLDTMNVKWWFAVSDSTVYTTLKTLEKRGLLTGTAEKTGNMPQRTLYTLTGEGRRAFFDTIRESAVTFDFDTNLFTIAAFFLDALNPHEKRRLLTARLTALRKYLRGIDRQRSPLWTAGVSAVHAANVQRMAGIVRAEITGAELLLAACPAQGTEDPEAPPSL